MKKEALEYLERVKETTQKSRYVPHGWGIDDMMVRENYDVQSVPYDKAVYAVEIANKGMTARPKPEWIDYKKQKTPYGEEVDLEKEINEHWDEWAKEDGFHSIDFAKHFFELGVQVSNKALKRK